VQAPVTTTLLFLLATAALAAWVAGGTWLTRRRHQPPPADPVGLDWIPSRTVRGRLVTWTPDDEPATPLPAAAGPDYHARAGDTRRP